MTYILYRGLQRMPRPVLVALMTALAGSMTGLVVGFILTVYVLGVW